MFNSIYITPTGYNRLDLGLLAEVLIFYNKVHLLASESMMRDLFKSCNPEIIIELIEEGIIKVDYVYNMLGVRHKEDQSPKVYSFVSFHSPDHSLDKITEKIFFEIIGRRGRSRRLANRFNNLVNIEYYEKVINKDTIKYFLDNTFINDAVTIILKYLLPEYQLPSNFYFTTKEDKNGIIVDSNIDINKANEIYSKKYSGHNLSIALILNYILNIKGYLHFASRFNDEIAADELHTALFRQKLNSVIKHYLTNKEQIELFQNFVFDEAKKIRESINKGEIKFEDLVDVIKKAKRFKVWLSNIESDKSLIKEYFREVTSDSILDKLPGKTFRWSFFTGTGIVIDILSGSLPVGTISLGAFDSFLLDKIVKGWKPNQFIKKIDRIL